MGQPKRLIIKEMIEAGDCTKDKIKEKLEISAASLATNFTYLRLMGHYPITGENDVLSFTDEAGWAKIQEERKANATNRKSATAKTPQERYVALEKKCVRTKTAAKNAEERYTNDPDSELLELRSKRADLDAKIAQLEIEALIEQFGDDLTPTVNEDGEEIEEVEEVEDIEEVERTEMDEEDELV